MTLSIPKFTDYPSLISNSKLTIPVLISNFSIYTTVSDSARYIFEPMNFKGTVTLLTSDTPKLAISLESPVSTNINVSASQVELVWKLTVSVVEVFFETLRQVDKIKPVTKADLKRALSVDQDILIPPSSSPHKPIEKRLNWSINAKIHSLHVTLDELSQNDIERRLTFNIENTSILAQHTENFTKFSLKMCSINAEHTKKYLNSLNSDWVTGEFEGKLIVSQGDAINFTFTRASTEHFLTHLRKTPDCFSKITDHGGKDFLHEIFLELQPIQLVLPLDILKASESLFRPIFQTPFPKFGKRTTKVPQEGCLSTAKINKLKKLLEEILTRLPLVHVKISDLEIHFPLNSVDLVSFELQSITVGTQPMNSLERKIAHQNLHEIAVNEGIIDIPGSPIEDRQYDIKIQGIKCTTMDPSSTGREIISENLSFHVAVAPGIMDIRSKNLVAGHNIEFCVESDFNVNLSEKQLSLIQQLALEVNSFANWVMVISEKFTTEEEVTTTDGSGIFSSRHSSDIDRMTSLTTTSGHYSEFSDGKKLLGALKIIGLAPFDGLLCFKRRLRVRTKTAMIEIIQPLIQFSFESEIKFDTILLTSKFKRHSQFHIPKRSLEGSN